jgi:hypothetical protein
MGITYGDYLWGLPRRIAHGDYLWGLPKGITYENYLWGLPMGITYSAYLWELHMGIIYSAYLWGLPIALTSGDYIWGLPMGITYSVGCPRKCFFHFRRNTEFFEKHTEFRGFFIVDFSWNSAEFRGIPYVFAYGIPQITK